MLCINIQRFLSSQCNCGRAELLWTPVCVCLSEFSPTFSVDICTIYFCCIIKIRLQYKCYMYLQCATIYQKYVPFLFHRTITEHDLPPFPCPVSSLTHTLWRVFSRSRNWYHFCCSNRETQPWKSHNWVKKFLKLPLNICVHP